MTGIEVFWDVMLCILVHT